ncbi:glycosyl hydrolase family 18 protein [Streptomyces sp. NPDC003077]|uniref:glycosyl hydrolase family 18 protein n=1 Tax=Streptomyces sp. NPDC003077 TaxID=3154443 RepID=UPI0033A837F2
MDLPPPLRARRALALVLAAAALTGLPTSAAGASGTPSPDEAPGFRHDALAGQGATGGPQAPQAPATRPRRAVSAWLPYWGDTEAAYQDARRHAAQLHTVSPFWYETTSDTAIKRQKGAGARRIVDGLRAVGIKVVPTVTETLNAPAMAALLQDPARRRAHVAALVRLATGGGYDGLDLDYETMANGGDATQRRRVRDGYAALVADLCARLRTRGKQCVITATARADDTGVHDYARLGRAADRLRLMGYDLHWSGGAPGPLSSPSWYGKVLRHAVATVPVRKIEMAFPGYGWDWTKGAKSAAKHLTWHQAEALRKRVKAPYGLDPASRTPHFTYREGTTTHEVWYQDARGVAAHIPVLRKYRVRATGLWALGFEDPAFWRTIQRAGVVGRQQP